MDRECYCWLWCLWKFEASAAIVAPTSIIESPLFLPICITRFLLKDQGRDIWLGKPMSYPLAERCKGLAYHCKGRVLLFSLMVRGGPCLPPRFLRRNVCSYRKDFQILGSQKKAYQTKEPTTSVHNTCLKLYFISWEQSISIEMLSFFFFFFFLVSFKYRHRMSQESKHLQS